MVTIEDYEQALWGQYLMATGGGGTRQVLWVHAAIHVSTVRADAVTLIRIKDISQDIKAKIPLNWDDSLTL